MSRSDCLNATFGTTFKAKRWLSLDGCGVICIILSFSLHIYALVQLATRLIRYNATAQILFGSLYVPSFILAVASLFMAWMTNPGAVPLGARPLNVLDPDLESAQEGFTRDVTTGEVIRLNMPRGIRRCHKCNDNYKPTRAHHDSVTGRCIVKMDHYCPWVCNAIGALNHKFFLLFLLYTFITSIVSIILIAMGAIECGIALETSKPNKVTSSYSAAKAAFEVGYAQFNGENDQTMPPGCDRILSPHVMMLFIVSVTFFVFTLCMILEQKDVVLTNKGKIARMKIRAGKAEEHELGRVTNDFNEVFGGDSPYFAYHWLLPIPIWFPEGMRDVVLGYEWDETYSNIFETPDASTASTTNTDERGALTPIPTQVNRPLVDESREHVPTIHEEPETSVTKANETDKKNGEDDEKVNLLKLD